MAFLQKYLKYVLTIAQCFGLLPVFGVYADNPKYLKFSWSSWKVCYTILLSVCTLFLLGMGCYHFWISDFELPNLTIIVFFLNGFTVIMVFLKLAKEWPEFMQYWQDAEQFIRSKIVVPSIFSYILYMILGAAVVEHGLLIIYSVTSQHHRNITNGFHQFVVRDSYIFKYIEYSWYLGVFIKIISFANTFYWNFMDVFIIAISIVLTALLKMINYRIRTTTEIKLTPWADLRRHYNRLCKLCFRVEEKISHIILISFASNLYFILVQLHGSVKKRRSTMESVYFFFSFGLLLLRTLAVCLFVANIDDQNTTSIRLLSNLNVYNAESKRLFQQISSVKVALTGMNFFTVTRGLVLNIAAAIVTYEIFLIQYINTIED